MGPACALAVEAAKEYEEAGGGWRRQAMASTTSEAEVAAEEEEEEKEARVPHERWRWSLPKGTKRSWAAGSGQRRAGPSLLGNQIHSQSICICALSSYCLFLP